MTDTARRAKTDPDALLAALVEHRHVPGEPIPQAVADDAEVRLLRRRQRGARG